MRLPTTAVALLATLPTALAGLCSADTLLGLGGFPQLANPFTLVARLANGTTYPVTQAATPLPSGFFFPLTLGAPSLNASDPSVTQFTIQGNAVYAIGGLVLSTAADPLLAPVPLYVSASSGQLQQQFAVFNGSCDGGPEVQVLRFSTLGLLALASASVQNSTAGTGAALSSPILKNLLTVGTSVDFLVQFVADS